MNPTFRGFVDNSGRLKLGKPATFQAHLLSLKNREVRVTVEKESASRTSNQNAYYHAVIVKTVADEMGITSEEAHEFLKRKLLPVHVIEFKGERYEYSGSTRLLNTIQFEDYCEKCRNWAALELNCYVPMPNEVTADFQ